MEEITTDENTTMYYCLGTPGYYACGILFPNSELLSERNIIVDEDQDIVIQRANDQGIQISSEDFEPSEIDNWTDQEED